MIDSKHNLVRDASGTRELVLQACRAMLRPIVRLLLKSGIVHRDLNALIREVYVEITRTEFGLRGRPTSISRTALLTGMARKEVRRIANLLEGDAYREPSSQDRITRVLSGWFQDPDYLDSDGRPLAIRAEGLAPSFADLKARYGGDVPASAILRELLNAGTVQKLPDGKLQPVTRYFMPNPADPEHLLRAGDVIEDIGSTVMRNLYRDTDAPSWFERRAINTQMPPEKVAEFRAHIETEGQKFLEQIDAWLSENEAPRGSASTHLRLGLGMYIIRDDLDD